MNKIKLTKRGRKTLTVFLSAFLFSLSLMTCVRADNTNLAPIPAGWTTANSVPIVSGYSAHIVYPVTWQGKTAIKMERDLGYIAQYGFPCTNEANSYWLSIKPGDHIVYKVWFWVESSTAGDNGNAYAGAMMGIDLYGNGRICGLTTPDGHDAWPDYPPAMTQCIVPFGSARWIQRSMDFIVQNSYAADPWNPSGGHPAGEMVVPTGCIATIAIYTHNPNTEAASVYFADAELYINPGEISSSKVTVVISTTEGGTTSSPPGTYTVTKGAYGEIEAIPDSTHIFSHWEINGVDYGNQNPLTGPANANYAILAVFETPSGVTAAPSIEIWTNTATYARGKTMSVYIQVSNPGPAITVKIIAKIGLPGGGTYGLWTIWTGTLPAGYNSGVKFWKTFPIPYSTEVGIYSWIAELRKQATNALIDSDTYYWTVT